MPKSRSTSDWVDSYVRDKLTPEEVAEFEQALLESEELQLELETALGIRQAVLLDDASDDSLVTAPMPKWSARNSWQRLAVAACAVFAVFFAGMYLHVRNENGELRSTIARLEQPRGVALTVHLDIMRSADNQTPEVIIQKPEGDGLMVLDVELSPAFTGLNQVRFSLRTLDNVELTSWVSVNYGRNRLSAVFNASLLPDGQLWLVLSDPKGQTIERRLLEFR